MERKHPPLRRVSRGMAASVSLGDDPRKAQGAEDRARRAELNEEDSCYSSCSEESHPSLSRESSETVGSDFGLGRLKIGQHRRSTIASTASPLWLLSDGDNAQPAPPVSAPPHLVEFARNLGYSEERLIAVLRRVGCDAGQVGILRNPQDQHEIWTSGSHSGRARPDGSRLHWAARGSRIRPSTFIHSETDRHRWFQHSHDVSKPFLFCLRQKVRALLF